DAAENPAHANPITAGAPADVPAVAVVVREEDEIFDQLVAISPAFHHLGTACMVAILVVLLLVYAEDLRDRIIVLAGTQQISVTSQALEEAASKVGKYLFMLSIVNAGFGLGVAAGLYFIGIPNALLLGVLAGVLRFIPLVGAWMGAAIPLLLAMAVVPGWGGVLWTFVVFAALEILANFLVEPLIYGHSTGISSTAVIVAILFWTLVWGGVGLLLAVPVTVCVVVFGKYVEPLRVFYILLGDEPMLSGERRLYHRLVTGDVAASEEIVRTALEESSPTQVYDQLLLPALRTARADHARGALSEERLSVVTELLETLTAELQTTACEAGSCTVACVAVEDGDRIATRMAATAVGRALEHGVPVLESSMATDLQTSAEANGTSVLLLVTTSSESLVRGRLLYKMLAKRIPKLRVYVLDLADVSGAHVTRDAASGLTIVTTIAAAVEKVGQVVRGQASVNATADPAPLPLQATAAAI
ncbi:MAG TPA: AI-2E family transporter, partial [Tepidisphaeraceae bacterium]